MNLRDIFKEILDIARDIGNNTLSYPIKPLVIAGKRDNPADLLAGVAARFTTEISNNIMPSKHELESALKELKKIAKDYGIVQLRKPIKDYSEFLNNLGGIA